jgi:hypothetical protein
MKKFLLILLLVLVLGIGGGYIYIKNKLNSLSDSVHAQVDLGVNESSDTIYTLYDEIGYVNNLKGETPMTGELVFEGGIPLDRTFSQKEINSWISSWEETWNGIPFENLQVRINSDGSVEASSLISVDKAEEIGKTLGYSSEQIDKAKSYLKYIPDPLPLYAKGSASIYQNEMDISVESFKVANSNLPSSLASAVGEVIEDVIERARNMSDDTDIQMATVSEQGVLFKGTVPASVRIK